MAKNSPVRIWVIKHSDRRDPKFHHTEMLEGAGRSTIESLAMFNRGCVLRMLAISYMVIIICYGMSHNDTRITRRVVVIYIMK